jgi:uncharacterized protein (DUF1810 family)
MPHDLERFRTAQDDPFAGFGSALAEMRAGQKQGHWIWYVFPQLAGLGSSRLAQAYGISGRAEAIDYLRDPVLRERLLTITEAVAAHARDGLSLVRLMNSRIDAQKLVSSLTLFESVAREHPGEGERYRSLTDAASTVLDAAGQQGFARCRYTLEVLAQQSDG